MVQYLLRFYLTEKDKYALFHTDINKLLNK
jgi:hypothetical protein